MEIIRLEVKGHTGTAEIKWIPGNEWSVGHYIAFYNVPFQPSRRENLFIYDKENIAEAIEKATTGLRSELSRCTLCG